MTTYRLLTNSMNLAVPLLHPLFAQNHDVVLRRGGGRLQRRLKD